MSLDDAPDYSRAALFDPIARSYGRIAPLVWPTIFRPIVTDVRAAQRASTRILDAGTKARAANTEFVLGSITDIPFFDATFDGLTCAGVLDTLPNIDVALAEFRRVLSPTGVVSLVLRGPDRRLSRLVEYLSRIHVRIAMTLNPKASVGTGPTDRVVDQHWSREPVLPRIGELAHAAGLHVVRVKPTPFLAHVVLRPITDCDSAAR
jgi:SAM-dependent methyltransferase